MKYEDINYTVDISYIFFGFFFVLSCVNTMSLIFSVIVVCLWEVYRYRIYGAIDALLFMQLRTVVNTELAVSMTTISYIKWIVVFGLSFYILLNKYNEKNERIVPAVNQRFVFFAILIGILPFFVSSYPVVSLFKVVSWIIPFCALIKGVYLTDNFNWIHRINIFLGILVLNSVILIPFSIGYYTNEHAFQGLFNQPNMFGVMIAVFAAGYLYEHDSKLELKTVFICTVLLYMAYLTESRTGTISLVVTIIIYILTSRINSRLKALIIIILICACGVILQFNGGIIDGIVDFIYKGDSGVIIHSRAGQVTDNLYRFSCSPLFGTGFNVPYTPGAVSYAFSFDLVTENGNLILALLGDIGIIGLLGFIYCFTFLKKNAYSITSTIFWVPFLVSMGEMSFFSTNNFAIILYFYFAIFLTGKPDIIEHNRTYM